MPCTTGFTKTITGYGAAASSTATRASAPLMLKGNFSLTLLATQGLLYSLFALMNVPLCLSDYAGASKRVSTVTVAYRQPFKAKVTDLVIGKAIGRSENTAQRSGVHLAVDPATHNIVAAQVSLENVHNTEVLPTLLNPLRRSWDVFMRMTPMTAKPAISLSCAKGRQPVSRLARTRDSGKRGTQEMRPCW